MNATLFYLFVLVVALAPLPLGSNREWSWSLCALLVGIVGVPWALGRMFGIRFQNKTAIPDSAKIKGQRPVQFHGQLNPGGPVTTPRSVWLIALLFLVPVAWALFQASTLAPDSWAHPLWPLTAEVLGLETTAHVSLAPDDTVAAAMRLLSYGIVFWMAFHWGRDSHRARRVLQLLVVAGVAYSVYGLYNFWTGSETFFWFEDAAYKNDVRGTFVNRNHFATYAGLILLCALTLFYRAVVVATPAHLPAVRRVPKGARATTRGDRVEQFMLAAWKLLLVILVLTTALILTHSRGGFISTLVGAGVLLAALAYRRPVGSARARAAIGLAAVIAAVSFWLTSEVLLDRIDRKGLEDNLRFSAYELILESSADNPALGFGYGGFSDSFRLYRSDGITEYLDRAHNSYLENIFELGWPAALALFAAIGGAALICLRGLVTRGRSWYYPALGLAATTLVAIHAYFDFSLQMPAIAMTYAMMMGVACAQSFSSRS